VIRLDHIKLSFTFFGQHNILIMADILAIIWLTWTTNMVNWSKGIDGQLPGFVSITALFMGLLSQRFIIHDIHVQTVLIFSLIVAGAFLGFLPFNFYPQKIMPGYGGGALAGFLLGILSILSFGKIGTAILILAIPMLDAVYTIIRRLINKKSPFTADKGHLHHRLLELGWGKRRIAIFYWLISLILGLISLFVKGIGKIFILTVIAIVLFIFLLRVEQIKTKQKTTR
jgi:UDP-GlcNAc:undecaprenyl-phosphate GlcNAc-1-phosphate transferase